MDTLEPSPACKLPLKTRTYTTAVMAAITLGMAMETQAQGRSDLALAALGSAQHVSDELLFSLTPTFPSKQR